MPKPQFRPIDAEQRATLAVELMAGAQQLADAGADDRQRRVLARYVVLHADTAHRWLHQSARARPRDRAAASALRRLRQEYAKQKGIRDTLTARRMQLAAGRAVDLQRTVELWTTLTRTGIHSLVGAAVEAASVLGLDVEDAPIAAAQIGAARADLAPIALRPDVVYTDDTSYAAGEPNLLSMITGGQLGRTITQINDVHNHLEILNALRQHAHAPHPLATVVRTAVIAEMKSLLDLTVGPASPATRGTPLLGRVEQARGEHGYDVLLSLAELMSDELRIWIAYLRDKAAAHFDEHLSFEDLRELLLEEDIDGLLDVADTVFDFLDAAAISHVDLGTLILGRRQLHTAEPATAGSVPPALQPAEYAEFLDAPYVGLVAGGFGSASSAHMAGVIAGRARNRRLRWREVPAAT